MFPFHKQLRRYEILLSSIRPLTNRTVKGEHFSRSPSEEKTATKEGNVDQAQIGEYNKHMSLNAS